MAWTEIIDNRQKTRSAEGSTGTRTFQEDSAGTATLPNIGEPFDADNPRLLCITEVTKYTPTHDADEGGVNRRRLTFQYSTKRDGSGTAADAASGGDGVPIEELPRSCDAGAEFTNAGSYQDANFVTTNPDGSPGSVINAVDADRLLRITKISIPIGKAFSSFDDIMARNEAYTGKVNNAPLFGAARGKILFLGIQADETTDPDGNKAWVGTCKYEYRNPGWNYLLNTKEANPQFRLVQPPLYEEAAIENAMGARIRTGGA